MEKALNIIAAIAIVLFIYSIINGTSTIGIAIFSLMLLCMIFIIMKPPEHPPQ